MYKSNEKQIMLPDDFFLPFGGKLNKENRWVKLAQIIPWWEYEEEYGKNFKPSKKGQIALSVRIALGTLIIKNTLRLSDEETVRQISENCYMQYFLGFPQFIEGAPFAESMVTYFRKRFRGQVINKLNEQIAMEGIEKEKNKHNDKDDDDNNSGGRMRIPDYPDGNSGGIRTLNRRHPDTLSINLILH